MSETSEQGASDLSAGSMTTISSQTTTDEVWLCSAELQMPSLCGDMIRFYHGAANPQHAGLEEGN